MIAQIVEAGILGRFAILLPETLSDELAAKAWTKPYLAERMTAEEVRELADILAEVSETDPKITEVTEPLGR